MVEDTDNILEEVKRMLSIEPSVTEFDTDIVSHINSAFFTLFELGIGPSSNPFYINAETKWESFDTIIPKQIILDYLFLKTKLVFDPPTASALIEAIRDRISELEFRMNIFTDNGGGIING